MIHNLTAAAAAANNKNPGYIWVVVLLLLMLVVVISKSNEDKNEKMKKRIPFRWKKMKKSLFLQKEKRGNRCAQCTALIKMKKLRRSSNLVLLIELFGTVFV